MEQFKLLFEPETNYSAAIGIGLVLSGLLGLADDFLAPHHYPLSPEDESGLGNDEGDPL